MRFLYIHSAAILGFFIPHSFHLPATLLAARATPTTVGGARPAQNNGLNRQNVLPTANEPARAPNGEFQDVSQE